MELQKVTFSLIRNLKSVVNALIVDDKYSGTNMQNLPQQFQTPASQKQKIFSGFFIEFLKCAWNLELSSLIISEIIDAERRVYLNV